MSLRPVTEEFDEGIIADSVIELSTPLVTDWTGWLLIWKPTGVTSFDVIRWIKSALRGAKPRPKIGHTGTLDPFAEGLLLVGLGGATRLIPLLEDWQKTYRATCRLGSETTTLDPEGTVTREAPIPSLTRADIEAQFPAFIGSVWQTPPAFSAIKQDGEPLYRKARRGENVEVPPRLVEIQRLSLIELTPDSFEIEVACGGGTYIRSLCRDLALALGTAGHCSALQRTGLGTLTDDGAWHIGGPEEVTPEALQVHFQRADWPLASFPSIILDHVNVLDFGHGRRCQGTEIQELPAGADPRTQAVRLYDEAGLFVGIGIVESSEAPYVIQPKTVLIVME